MSITATNGPLAFFAAASAFSSSAIEATFTASAPMLSAWARKSIRLGVTCRAVSSRLLNSAPPVARCNRLMQPKPRLSVITTVTLIPIITAVASSEFIIM